MTRLFSVLLVGVFALTALNVAEASTAPELDTVASAAISLSIAPAITALPIMGKCEDKVHSIFQRSRAVYLRFLRSGRIGGQRFGLLMRAAAERHRNDLARCRG